MLSARAEATTRRTYNRPLDDEGSKFETWEQTVDRSHYQHHEKLWLDAAGSAGRIDRKELNELNALGMSRKGLVAGRTLWLGGTPYAYSRAASQFNCSGLEITTVYDMVDAFWLLLNGCGVGGLPRAGTLRGYSQPIPSVQIIPSERDKNFRGPLDNEEVKPTADNDMTWTVKVGDSAMAWAKSLGKLLQPPKGRVKKLVLDFSHVRGRGGRLKGYGWICNGYEPLADALVEVHGIMNRCAGNLLTEEEIMDMFNLAGTVLSSRRSAEAGLLDAHHPHAEEFSRRKHEYWRCKACGSHNTRGGRCLECGRRDNNDHRRQSNNSLLFWKRPSVDDLCDLLSMNLNGGEPGFVNAAAALRRCPWFRVFNPCLTGDTLVAVADGRNAVPIAQLAEESGGVNRFDVYSARPSKGGRYGGKWKVEITSAVAIMTGVKPVGRLTFSNGDSIRCTADHRIALANGTYLPAQECVGKAVERFFTRKNRGTRRLINTESNGFNKQHRMMWERVNGPKPEGYEIDHIDTTGGDFLDNLQLLTAEEHREKSSVEKRGEGNPIHRVKDRDAFRRRRSAATLGANNPRYSGLTDEYLIDLATVLHRDGLPISIGNLRALDPKVPQSFSKSRFGGSIENLRKIVKGETEYVPPTQPQPEEPCEPEQEKEPLVAVGWEPLQDEPVYDLIVEKNRNFYVITSGDDTNNYLDSEGLLVHNCFEIMLPSSGFCNLVSLCLPSFNKNFHELERAVWVMARANYRQTCVDLQDGVLQPRWHQTNESLALCGVSFTGIVQAGWLTDYQIIRLRNAAVTGAYSMADELGRPRPKAITTIKPEGTRSKITNWGAGYETAEGMHAPLGRYIFNWINFSTEDPLVNALRDAGYKTMLSPSDANNVLVRFPVEYANVPGLVKVKGREVNLEPAVDQLRRYLRWNTLWADHNVSSTISFDETEVPDLAKLIHSRWDDGYIATAFLRRADPTLTAADLGHPYLPQEVVSEEDYREAIAGVKPIEWDQFHHGIYDLNDASDCPTGVCPTK